MADSAGCADTIAVSPELVDPVDAEAVERTEDKVASHTEVERKPRRVVRDPGRDRAIAGVVLLSILLGLLLLMALTTAMFTAFRNVAVTSDGMLAAPDETLTGVAAAIDRYGLAEFPK
eukprot:symbB.v1.2.026351.t1/scaffold2626.1/size122458/1